MADINGGDGLKKKLGDISGKLNNAKEVAVGFPEGTLYPNGTPLATAAASANFGNPSRGVPPRPFFSNAVAAGKKTWGADLATVLRAVGYDAAMALEQMGTQIAFAIAESLVDTNGPPLSPITLLLRERFPTMEARDSMTFADVLQARHDIANGTVPDVTTSQSKPLVWTGFMLQHLYGPQAYEVKT